MICENCKKPDPTKVCGKCHEAYYCGKKCQREHWKVSHKLHCGNKSLEDTVFENQRKGVLQTNQSEMVDMMTKMAISIGPKTSKNFLLRKLVAFYSDMPDLVKEFAEHMAQSKITDIPMAALELLREVNVSVRLLYLQELAYYGDCRDSTENPLLSDKINILKVIHSQEKHKINWFFKAPLLDVYDRTSTKPYEFSIYQSFSNAYARKEILETGRVHVAIGFVDLSMLIWMDLVPGENPGPLRFIGFEASPFNVAKTRVIAAMFCLEEEEITNAIIQVWYSSCWSEETLRIFRLAVAKVKDCCEQPDSEVFEILSHWLKANPRPISFARQQWLKKVDISIFDPVYNTLNKNARNSLAEYFLTGQLLEATCASVAMFDVPSKFQNKRARNESYFHSLDMQKFMLTTRRFNGDFVAGAIMLLGGQIQHLHSLVRKGKVSIEIEPPAIVSLKFPQTVAKIAAMKPYTISWNNCLDYMPTRDFHRLAQACSAPKDTLHFGYSMNWPCDVKGGSSLSWPVGEHNNQHMHEMIGVARDSVASMYRAVGAYGLLKCPPLDNPINVFDIVARHSTYKLWAEKFFKGVKVANIEPLFYSVFTRVNSALFFTWTYDDSISFNPVSKSNKQSV